MCGGEGLAGCDVSETTADPVSAEPLSSEEFKVDGVESFADWESLEGK